MAGAAAGRWASGQPVGGGDAPSSSPILESNKSSMFVCRVLVAWPCGNLPLSHGPCPPETHHLAS
eukprot:4117915-Prymnesium_polylepis.1